MYVIQTYCNEQLFSTLTLIPGLLVLPISGPVYAVKMTCDDIKRNQEGKKRMYKK